MIFDEIRTLQWQLVKEHRSRELYKYTLLPNQTLQAIMVIAGNTDGQVCLIKAAEGVLVHIMVPYRGSCSILCPSRPGWPSTHASHSDSNSGRVSGPLGPSSRDSTSSS